MLEAFPAITTAEFAEACETLERKCHDNLDDTKWRSVRWNAEEGELLIHQVGDVVVVSSCTADNVTSSQRHIIDESLEHTEDMLIDNENEEDMNIVRRPVTTLDSRPAVTFSILVSPTYRVPVLWFWLSSSPSVSSKDLEHIYERIVTPSSHAALKGVGVMGGISMANHPLTDRPCFFVHPCNTHEALESVRVSDHDQTPLEYLILWLGIIGSAVGLHVPSRVIQLHIDL